MKEKIKIVEHSYEQELELYRLTHEIMQYQKRIEKLEKELKGRYNQINEQVKEIIKLEKEIKWPITRDNDGTIRFEGVAIRVFNSKLKDEINEKVILMSFNGYRYLIDDSDNKQRVAVFYDCGCDGQEPIKHM